MDNSENRLLDVFFYGLYMDPQLLAEKNVATRNSRLAVVTDFQLRLGDKATLMRRAGKLSIGMLYSITHAELHRLYWGAGLDVYGAEAVLAQVLIDDAKRYASLHEAIDSYRNIHALCKEQVVALCCNLKRPPQDDESNPVYREKLTALMRHLQIPLPDELLLTTHSLI